MAEHRLPEREAYPNNSITAKEQKPSEHRKNDEQNKVVKGKVRVKKKAWTKRMAEAFGAREGQGILDYIFYDIIVPATKNMIIDSISDGVAMAFGESPRRRGRSRDRSARYDYDRVSYIERDRRRRDDDRRDLRYSSSIRDYENIVFDNKDDADEVISTLVDIIDRDGQASVSQLYRAAGVSEPDYAVGNYGWFKLGSAYARRVSDGYVLDLPKPVVL